VGAGVTGGWTCAGGAGNACSEPLIEVHCLLPARASQGYSLDIRIAAGWSDCFHAGRDGGGSVLVLTGDRVVLRPVNPDDVERLWLAKQDPLTWARTTAAPLVPSSLESVRAWYADRGGSKSDAAFSVDVEGGLAGQASLFGVDDLARTAEVGLWLLPEMRGRGLGQDVLRVLVDYGFRSRNLRRVHLQTLAGNTAALRCYTAVGFLEEGRLREHAWVEGAYDDIVLMGLLRADRARQR